MNWDSLNHASLQRLRTRFLEGSAGTTDYWESEDDLIAYDETFAQRIGWKWDFVLSDLAARGWTPPPGALLDHGCGTGVAGRAMADHFGTDAFTALQLADRSPMAVGFAGKRALAKHPGWTVRQGGSESFETLVISHVLTELTSAQVEELLTLIIRATAVIWVEPGAYEPSLALIAIRERLRNEFHVVAPCTHRETCGLLAPGNEAHWCHHFARPPREIFQDAGWSRFAHWLGIDLGSLPLSYLVLDRRPPPATPPGAIRMIGHPRIYKAHALALGCEASGVSECRLTKRINPDAFKQWRKGRAASLQVWEREGAEILRQSNLTPEVPE